MGANWQPLNNLLWLSIPLITAGAFINFANTVVAQVTPDQSLGKENSVVTPVDPNSERIDGGAVRGSNLFHSFKEFNVGEGKRIDFANPAGIENILSRVTGNNPSNIFGTLGVLGDANLFLLNPNGIIFGPNSRLDIRGSFVASTGKGINFADRILYGGNNLESKPLLSMAVPVGLQYGTQQAGDINNQGNLQVGERQKLTLFGNNITFDAPVNIAAKGVELTAEANNDIKVNADITTNQGKIELIADKDDSGAGALIVNNSDNNSDINSDINIRINTKGGNFVGKGKGSEASTSGVNITNSTINAAGGKIKLTGVGKDGGEKGRGINIGEKFSIETTGAGTITLDGTSGVGNCAGVEPCGNHGIFIGYSSPRKVGNSQIKTEDGTITLIGEGAPTEGNINHGITISHKSLVESTGTGLIEIKGTTEAKQKAKKNEDVFGNDGISITRSATVKTATGNIIMNGTGGWGGGEKEGNQGIIFYKSKVTSKSGDIELTGTGRGVKDKHYGIWVDGDSEITSENGNITLKGKSEGTGKDNIGVYLNGKSLIETTGTGTITLKGRSGTGSCAGVPRCGNHGILIGDLLSEEPSKPQVKTKDGKIILIGKGLSSEGHTNHGISIWYNSLVESTGTGSIKMTGTTEARTNEDFPGHGNDGISMIEAGTVKTATGTISMTGIGGEGEGGNQGIVVLDTNSKVISESGDITLTGTGKGIGDKHYGIWIGGEKGGEVSSEDGTITLNGKSDGTGEDNIDIYLNRSGLVETTGTGEIFLNAISTNQNEKNPGIKIRDIGSKVSSTGGADIYLNADSIFITERGQVKASTDTLKKGGDISVNASNTLKLSNGGALRAQTQGIGNAGNITIDTKKLDIQSDKLNRYATGIGTDTSLKSTGNAGNLTINATESVTISGNDDAPFNPEPSLENVILITGSCLQDAVCTGLTSSTLGSGQAGNLTINTKRLTIKNKAGVATTSLNPNPKQDAGDGGMLTVNATELKLENRAGLATTTLGSGDAGDLIIDVNKIKLEGGAVLSTDTFGSGKGGDLNFTTNELNILDGSRVGAATIDLEESANTITINEFRNRFELNDGTDFVSGGQAGNVKINTPENKAQLIEIDSVSANGKVSSGIFSNSKTSGNAGNVEIYANKVNLTREASITADTSGSGKSGDLNIDANELEILNGGTIAVSSTGEKSTSGNMNLTADSILLKNQASINALTSIQGKGGDININVANNIDFKGRDSEISSEAFGNANGGNLSIKADYIVSEDSITANNDIVVTADGTGKGGNARIDAFPYGFLPFNKVRTPDSDISAGSRLGQDGTLKITADNPEPQLPQQPNTPEIVQVCPASQGVTTRAAGRSEYINTGHGGLPPNPNQALESNTAQVPWVTLNPQENKPTANSKPKVIREAQGWVKMPNGKLLLTTRKSNSSSSSCVFQSN